MHTAFVYFREFFQHYGLLAVFLLLLLENFGLPLPGELSLLYAGFHLRVYGGFSLLALIAVGVAGSSLGQVTGYFVGRYAHNWVLRTFPIKSHHYQRYSIYFQHHGATTILFARFVTGLRIFAGILAGLGHMHWQRFVFFDFCGAILWVSAIASLGALLGSQWRPLLHVLGRVDLVILVVAIVLIWVAWHRLRGEHEGRGKREEGNGEEGNGER